MTTLNEDPHLQILENCAFQIADNPDLDAVGQKMANHYLELVQQQNQHTALSPEKFLEKTADFREKMQEHLFEMEQTKPGRQNTQIMLDLVEDDMGHGATAYARDNHVLDQHGKPYRASDNPLLYELSSRNQPTPQPVETPPPIPALSRPKP